MRLLRLLHLYCGLVLSLFLVLFALTGGALLYKEELWRLAHPDLARPVAPATAAEHARAFDRIAAFFPGETVRQIKLPRPGLAAYHVYLRGQEAFVSQDGRKVIDRWTWYGDPLALLTDLHINLATGRTGRTVAGAIGIFTALMALTGLVLWWPLRSRFSAGSLWPRDLRRPSLLRLHRDLGAAASGLIVLFALSGSGVVFYGTARVLLNGMFGDPAPDNAPPAVATTARAGMADAEIIGTARAAVPGARLMSYYPPPDGSSVHYFRLRQHGEVHPNGRSMAFVEGTDGSVLAAVDATRQPPGERAAQWLYPLHSGKVGGEPYRSMAALAALALAAMAVTGPATWLQMRRRRTGRRTGSGRASGDRQRP